MVYNGYQSQDGMDVADPMLLGKKRKKRGSRYFELYFRQSDLARVEAKVSTFFSYKHLLELNQRGG